MRSITEISKEIEELEALSFSSDDVDEARELKLDRLYDEVSIAQEREFNEI